jgi:hypothetical protein
VLHSFPTRRSSDLTTLSIYNNGDHLVSYYDKNITILEKSYPNREILITDENKKTLISLGLNDTIIMTNDDKDEDVPF